jgi:hypothetical protein
MRSWGNEGVGSVEGISVQAIQDGSSELVGKVGDAAKETASQYAKNAAAGILSSIGKKLNSFAAGIIGESGVSGGIVSDMEEKATSSANEATGSATNGSSGASVSGGSIQTGAVSLDNTEGQEFLVPPPFATIVARIHVPFSFSVNRAGVSYTINWGDGSVSKGTVPNGNSFIISHEWEKQGDYTVQVDIHDGETQKYFYSFPVRIYE